MRKDRTKRKEQRLSSGGFHTHCVVAFIDDDDSNLDDEDVILRDSCADFGVSSSLGIYTITYTNCRSITAVVLADPLIPSPIPPTPPPPLLPLPPPLFGTTTTCLLAFWLVLKHISKTAHLSGNLLCCCCWDAIS